MRNLTDQQIEKIAEIDNLTALGLGAGALGAATYGLGHSPAGTRALGESLSGMGQRISRHGHVKDFAEGTVAQVANQSKALGAYNVGDRLQRAGKALQGKAHRAPRLGMNTLQNLGKKGLIGAGIATALGILT